MVENTLAAVGTACMLKGTKKKNASSCKKIIIKTTTCPDHARQ
jgi:hypothetical protein